MNRRKIRRLLCLLILIADITGLLFVFGIFERQFYPDRFQTFTVIAALNVLVYYVFDFFYLKRNKSVFIPGWKYSVFIDCTIISMYGLLYLFSSYKDASLQRGLVILWIILPILLIIDWAANEKHHMHYRFVLIGLFLPVLYMMLALVLGHFNHGLGMNGAGWPYPFLNVDQLGWQLVIESCVFRVLFWLIYSWLIVKIDRRAGRRKRK